MTLALGVLLGLSCAVLPLIPEPYRIQNFAAYGAVGLFVAGRMGILPGLVLCLVSKILGDLFNYVAHDYQADYFPLWSVIVSFAVYPIVGSILVRRTQNPLRITGGAVGASVLFFLVSNFGAWLEQAMTYSYTLAGLLECYKQGLPFYRGTLLSDLGFTAGLFAAHRVLSHYYFHAENTSAISVENR
jgi:hypothetical protein